MMMTRVALVAAAALLLVAAPALTSARRLVWRGGDTNFNNPQNWEGMALPSEGSGVGEVDLRHDQAYTTIVEPNTYDVGRKIKFPDNGRIVFGGSDMIKFKFNGEAEGPTVNFLGPRDIEAYDFNCPENWRNFRGADVIGDAVADPPRQFDSVLFPSTSSYYVFSEAPIINVQSVHLGVDFDSSLEVTSCSDFPENQFDGIMCPNFFINNEEECVGVLSNINSEGLQECMWFNSCPTPAQELAQDERIQDAYQREADRVAALQNEVITRDFSLEIPKAVIADDAVLQYLTSTYANFLDPVIMAVKMNTMSELWTIVEDPDTFAIAYASGKFFISGQVTAKRVLVYGTSANIESTADATYMVDGDAPFFIALVNNVIVEVHRLYAQAATETLQNTIEAACNENDTALVEDILFAVDTLAEVVETPTASLGLIEAACPNLDCGDNATAIAIALETALEAMSIEASMEIVDIVAENLAKVNGSTCIGDLFADPAFLDTLEEIESSDAALEMATPMETQFESIPIYFGSALPTTTLRLIMNSRNYDSFQEAVINRLQSLGFADSVEDATLTLVPTSGNRRRATGEYEITVVVTYVVSCIDSMCSAHQITAMSAIYGTIVSAMDGLAAGFTFEVHECYVDDSGAYLTLPDGDCLSTRAQAILMANGGDRQAAHDVLYAEIECGVLGRNVAPDANDVYQCYEAPSNADTLNQAVWDAIGPEPTDAPDASASAGLPLPAVAGGAAVVLIIIIVIVVLIVRRKNSGTSEPKAAKSAKSAAGGVDARNVVAFENPMYEDNSGAGTFADDAAIYNDVEDDGEGLYDEPAFNGAARENPLYESTGDLTALGDDDNVEGGYLDVAADTGYLDVNGEGEGADDDE